MGYGPNDPILEKLAQAEPIFVLRGQDNLAADIVREWADRASKIPGCPQSKINEARALADDMDRWRPKKNPD